MVDNKSKTRLALFTVGMFALSALFMFGSHSAAQGLSGTTIHLAQQQQQQQNKKNTKSKGSSQKTTTKKTTTHKATTHKATTHKATTQKATTHKATTQKTTTHKATTQKATTQKATTHKATTQKVIKSKTVKTFTPHGHAVTTSRLKGLPTRTAGRAKIHGHNYSVWRRGYRVRYHDHWRTFVALSVLTPLLIGPDRFYPYAYLTAPELYCQGFTEDGCALVWDTVETLEGDIIPACVAYCPWQ
jgi:hypothetical protein